MKPSKDAKKGEKTSFSFALRIGAILEIHGRLMKNRFPGGIDDFKNLFFEETRKWLWVFRSSRNLKIKVSRKEKKGRNVSEHADMWIDADTEDILDFLERGIYAFDRKKERKYLKKYGSKKLFCFFLMMWHFPYNAYLGSEKIILKSF